MSAADLPDPTQVEGAPHPRDTARLIGQDAAEQAFLAAFNSGRLHHGWLLTGPRGTGKATLAWRIARFLLTAPMPGNADMFGEAPVPQSLEPPEGHPALPRIAAGADPGLMHVCRRPTEDGKRLRQFITVDGIRRLKEYFALSATEGGRRVVIVDSADDMNPNAANALLKLLEEPPANAFLLLVAHRPSALLPTIRSRCRELRLAPLGPEDMGAALEQAGEAPGPQAPALAALAGGSVGEALRLVHLEGLEIYGEILGVLGSLPRLDRPRALKLAEKAAARGQEARLDLMLDLIDTGLARLARTGAIGAPPSFEAAEGETATLSRLAPSLAAGRAWADLAERAGARLRHGRAVNLDPASLILDTVFAMQKTAQEAASQAHA